MLKKTFSKHILSFLLIRLFGCDLDMDVFGYSSFHLFRRKDTSSSQIWLLLCQVVKGTYEKHFDVSIF
jgi:hypothetical protein